jgi:hypothetical protein
VRQGRERINGGSRFEPVRPPSVLRTTATGARDEMRLEPQLYVSFIYLNIYMPY